MGGDYLISLVSDGENKKISFRSKSQSFQVQTSIYIIFEDSYIPSQEMRITAWPHNTADLNEAKFLLYDQRAYFAKIYKQQGSQFKFYLENDDDANIVEVIYGQNPSQIFLIKIQIQDGDTILTVEKQRQGQKQDDVEIQLQGIRQYDKSIYTGSQLFILFDKYFISMTSEELQIKVEHKFTQPKNILISDMSINDTYLIIARQKEIDFFKREELGGSTLPPPYKRIVYPELNYGVTSVRLYKQFLFFTTNRAVHQVHIQSKTRNPAFFDQSKNLYYDVEVFEDMIITFNRDNRYHQNGTNLLYVWDWDYDYKCPNSCTCSQGWYRRYNNKCVYRKDSLPRPQEPSITSFRWRSDWSDWGSSRRDTEITEQNQQSSETPIDYVEQQEQPEPSYISFIDKETLQSASTVFANVASIFTLNVTPKILVSLIAFIEDLWLYQYHRKRKRYPSTVWFFLNEVSFMGEMKMNPSFMKVSDFLVEQKIAKPQNQMMITYLQFNGDDDITQSYFLNSGEQIYKTNFIMNILLFLILKIIHLILYALNTCFPEKKTIISIYSYFKKYTKWWTLIISCIQSNIMMLGFVCFLQFLQTSAFSFLDKINLLLATLSLFFVIMYSLIFYPLIYTYQSKGISSSLLSRCKPTQNSYFWQPLMLIIRPLSRSMVNSLFLFSFGNQITLLLVLDILYIILIISIFSYFISKVVWGSVFFYSLTFFSFDMFFWLQQHYPQTTTWADRNLFGFITLSCMALFSFFQTVYTILYPLGFWVWKKCRGVKKIVSEDNEVGFEQYPKSGYFGDKNNRFVFSNKIAIKNKKRNVAFVQNNDYFDSEETNSNSHSNFVKNNQPQNNIFSRIRESGLNLNKIQNATLQKFAIKIKRKKFKKFSTDFIQNDSASLSKKREKSSNVIQITTRKKNVQDEQFQ